MLAEFANWLETCFSHHCTGTVEGSVFQKEGGVKNPNVIRFVEKLQRAALGLLK